MKNKVFLRLLVSIPVILIFLYFIPFLGVCIILLRYLAFSNQKRNYIPISLIGVGILFLVPKGLEIVFHFLNFDSSVIPYFNDFIHHEVYCVNLINYSKFLIILGIVFLIISYAFQSLFQKFENFLRGYISNQEKMNSEIYQKNDLIMQEKREKARNTHVVICPYCGADNILTARVGKCKFCRKGIQVKE